MTKEQIEEGNKLIAEFMGCYYVNDAPEDYPEGYWQHAEEEYPALLSEFRFHEAWDWLMPVLDKFTSVLDVAWKVTSKGVEIHNHGTGFDGNWTVNCPQNVIIDAWRGAVAYIKWYRDEAKVV